MRLSVIIPVLNDAASLKLLLQDLQLENSPDMEIIVVDGGSTDDCQQIATEYGVKFLKTEAGRARQMNNGAEVASGSVYWFLHADSRLPTGLLSDLLAQTSTLTGWGFYAIKLSGRHAAFRLIASMMNLRSRLTYIATGDQGLFMHQNLFHQCGGFAAIPIMEDIALSKKLKQIISPHYITQFRISTSSRRWEEQGIVRTTGLMWRLRLAYYFGAPPEQLVKQYYP